MILNFNTTNNVFLTHHRQRRTLSQDTDLFVLFGFRYLHNCTHFTSDK